jgi:hypothetical protein
MRLRRVREVGGTNLCPETGDLFFSIPFLSSPGKYVKLDHCYFLSHISPICYSQIILLSVDVAYAAEKASLNKLRIK